MRRSRVLAFRNFARARPRKPGREFPKACRTCGKPVMLVQGQKGWRCYEVVGNDEAGPRHRCENTPTAPKPKHPKVGKGKP